MYEDFNVKISFADKGGITCAVSVGDRTHTGLTLAEAMGKLDDHVRKVAGAMLQDSYDHPLEEA